MTIKKPKGLVFGGGGAKGIYQIGYLKGLRDKSQKDPFENVQYVSGTSIGTIIITLLMYNFWDLDHDYISDLTEIINFSDYKLFLRFGLGLFPFLFGFSNGILDNNKVIYKNLLKLVKTKSPNSTPSGNLEKVFFTSTQISENTIKTFEFNPREMKGFLYETFNIVRTATASSNIPVLFKPYSVLTQVPKTIHNPQIRYYYDGGLTQNLPIEPLLGKGLKQIDVLSLDYPEIEIKQGLGIFDTILNLTVQTGDEWSKKDFIQNPEDKKTKINFIYPKRNLGSLINFSKTNLDILFKLGYDEGFNAI